MGNSCVVRSKSRPLRKIGTILLQRLVAVLKCCDAMGQIGVKRVDKLVNCTRMCHGGWDADSGNTVIVAWSCSSLAERKKPATEIGALLALPRCQGRVSDPHVLCESKALEAIENRFSEDRTCKDVSSSTAWNDDCCLSWVTAQYATPWFVRAVNVSQQSFEALSNMNIKPRSLVNDDESSLLHNLELIRPLLSAAGECGAVARDWNAKFLVHSITKRQQLGGNPCCCSRQSNRLESPSHICENRFDDKGFFLCHLAR